MIGATTDSCAVASAPPDALASGLGSLCPGGVAPGTAYQWLAKGTGALRFAVCQDQSATFDSVFQDLAAEVIASAPNWCELELPQIPNLNLDWVQVLFTPANSPTQQWYQVASLAACTTYGQDFIVEDGLIKLCPATCSQLEGVPAGPLEVAVPCWPDG